MAGCAALPEPRPCGPASSRATRLSIWLLERAWHTEIGLPAEVLPEFAPPGANMLLLGFGKRDFMLLDAPGSADHFAGLVPGRAAIEVTGLGGLPATGFMLHVTPEGLTRLAAALRASFAPGPVFIAQRPGRRYYAASRGYSLAYTCNTWTADMLAEAGLPVRPAGIVFAEGVTRQVRAAVGSSAGVVCQAGGMRLEPRA